MKLLLVEDNPDQIAAFQTALSGTGIELTVAPSRREAANQIGVASFDLIVLDLKIPSECGGLDAEPAHGLAVHAEIKLRSSGTPIIIFSAFGNLQLASRLTEESERHDLWGSGQEQQLTVFREKTQLSECINQVKTAKGHLDALSRIEISTGTQTFELSSTQKKVLRLFARRRGGANVVVESIGGGLSNAKTFKLQVLNENGSIGSQALAKLGEVESLRQESGRFHRFVSPSVPPGSIAHEIEFVRAGAANYGGLFYGLAHTYDRSLGDLILTDQIASAQIVRRLRQIEESWQANVPMVEMPVQDIRRNLISDEAFGPCSAKLPFDWLRLEQKGVRVKWCSQHRDLHCLNVLVRDATEPLMIDYGEVGEGCACLDPLVLELSVIFHPACQRMRNGWPTVEQAANWFSLDAFTASCPMPDYIRACRTWAVACQTSDKGLAATLYGYAVRQLKYPNTDHDIAVALAKCAYEKIEAR